MEHLKSFTNDTLLRPCLTAHIPTAVHTYTGQNMMQSNTVHIFIILVKYLLFLWTFMDHDIKQCFGVAQIQRVCGTRQVQVHIQCAVQGPRGCAVKGPRVCVSIHIHRRDCRVCVCVCVCNTHSKMACVEIYTCLWYNGNRDCSNRQTVLIK